MSQKPLAQWKTKKPPAALAGGGLGDALLLFDSSGFASRMRIGAANSHRGNRHGNALDGSELRIGAEGVHRVIAVEQRNKERVKKRKAGDSALP